MEEHIAALKDELAGIREDRDRAEGRVLSMLGEIKDWVDRAVADVSAGNLPGYLHLHGMAREFEDPVRELRELRQKEVDMRLRIAGVVLGEED